MLTRVLLPPRGVCGAAMPGRHTDGPTPEGDGKQGRLHHMSHWHILPRWLSKRDAVCRWDVHQRGSAGDMCQVRGGDVSEGGGRDGVRFVRVWVGVSTRRVGAASMREGALQQHDLPHRSRAMFAMPARQRVFHRFNRTDAMLTWLNVCVVWCARVHTVCGRHVPSLAQRDGLRPVRSGVSVPSRGICAPSMPERLLQQCHGPHGSEPVHTLPARQRVLHWFNRTNAVLTWLRVCVVWCARVHTVCGRHVPSLAQRDGLRPVRSGESGSAPCRGGAFTLV